MKPPEPKPQPILLIHAVCQVCGRQAEGRLDDTSIAIHRRCWRYLHPQPAPRRQPIAPPA